MAAATTSGSIIAAATQEEVIQMTPAPLPPADSRDKPGEPSGWGFTLSVPFSSGNPRIEETRGIMHLYPDEAASSDNLPIGRKPLVCVIAVPNHMTYADFCRFCGAFIMHMVEMRIVRTDGVDDQYSVIIKFDNQISADGFYQHFNGRRFSSLEGDQCSVCYTIDVQHTGSIEHTQSSATSSAEEPSCPVCLERLDQDTSGILTTICNHSFHCSCISKWTDSSCPIAGEYNDLLTSQLDNQRKYYESLVLEIKEETEKEISEAIKKAVSLKLQKFQIKLDKCIDEKKFMEDINENLLKNEDTWKAKVQQLEEREQAAVKWRDEKIQGLEEQLGDLLMRIESQKVIDEPPKDSVASEIKGGTVLPVEPASSSSTGSTNEHGKKNRRRN